MRHKIMNVLQDQDNKKLYDPTSINWNNFDWASGYYKHQINSVEVRKPYLIAYAYYQDVEYEDVILLLNGIEYAWDIVPETEIKIPKKDDLDKFILENLK